MEKMMTMRSLYRSICLRSFGSSAVALATTTNHRQLRYFHLSSPSLPTSSKRLLFECQPPFAMAIGSIRYFSEDVAQLPFKDFDVKNAFKDLMGVDWNEIPNAVVHDTKNALSKNTEDKAGQEVLANVFRAAEAVEEFGGVLISLKMEIDDSIGMSGENVKPLSEDLVNALHTVYHRYVAYLDAFGPDEGYLKKKVENELGKKMIYLKMRCSGIGAEWGKVSVLGTSGLSGSYIEQRA